MIPVNCNDNHANHRHHQRFGGPLTAERKTAIFAAIESARANDNRAPAACLSGTSQIMTSPDGITWTARTAAENNSWLCVASN
ncbi:hypothetical protein [Azospirillum agricola]|uniref:hypothetical protein n=1 Tax=Azospirillum agricola TaxID=1720247 RepID=UPI000A0F1BB0|nr:hypothetical protein [Azospirillum agricola]SMH60443.1 hypothetical protein SAMN02982994_5500 [Azospirillum lipoferum]